MFDIQNIPSIVNHLQNISQIYKIINQTELQIHCPFCDDSIRPNAQNHGHLYIQTEEHVFYCFRCDSSGTLLKLLISTDFEDKEILKLLASKIKYNFSKDYYSIKTKKIDRQIIKKKIKNYFINIIKNDLNLYNSFQNYLFTRLGENINFSDFLICPGYLNNNYCCDFYNLESELIVKRLINQIGKYRFKLNKTSSGIYYFQEKNFEIYKRIVLTEGPFDLLSLYLYNHIFKDCLFLSISGKKYVSIIERLILEDLLIGKYEINLIFDKDNYKYKNFLYRAKTLCDYLNPEIEVKGYLPLIGKDVGDYPTIMEV